MACSNYVSILYHFWDIQSISTLNNGLPFKSGLGQVSYNITKHKQKTDSGARHLYVRISKSRSAIGFHFQTILIYNWIKPLGAAKTYLCTFWICLNYQYDYLQHNPIRQTVSYIHSTMAHRCSYMYSNAINQQTTHIGNCMALYGAFSQSAHFTTCTTHLTMALFS